MDLTNLKKLSDEPQKLQGEVIPILIDELKSRKEFSIVDKLQAFYNEVHIYEKKKSDKIEDIKDVNADPKLNGWLFLLFVNLIVKPIRVIYIHFNEFVPALKEIDEIEKMPRNGVSKLYGIETINFESLRNDIFINSYINIFTGILCFPLLYLMFNYKKVFPKYMIYYLVLIIFLSLAINLIDSRLFSLNLLVTAIIGSAWIYYLSTSDNVKNTFVK